MNHLQSVEDHEVAKRACVALQLVESYLPTDVVSAGFEACSSAAPTSGVHLRTDPWYVCLTKPRQEGYACSRLQEQGFEVYVPQLESWIRQRGEWRKKQAVMFPRYAFVRPVHAGQAISPVRSTPGVTCMVRFGAVLAGLADVRLAALRQAVAARNACAPRQPFVAGQHVIFSSGPLAGLQAIVSGVAAERVTVLMQLLGQDQNVVVPFQDLKIALS